jgi:hypothetical protein
MAGALGVGYQRLNLWRRRRAGHHQRDGDLFKVGRCFVDFVFFCVAEESGYVGGGIVNGHVVKRREPRHLCQQSEGDTYHEVLKW